MSTVQDRGEKNRNFVDFGKNKLNVIIYFICVHVERVNNKVLKVKTLESKQTRQIQATKTYKD